MVGWHYQLNGHEFELAPGVGDGQESLAFCIPWGCKESDMTNQTELKGGLIPRSCPTLVVHQDSLSVTNSWSLPKLTSIESVMHPTISSSVVPFSSYLQSFPASGSFPVSQFFASGGQSIGVSASASDLPMNTLD